MKEQSPHNQPPKRATSLLWAYLSGRLRAYPEIRSQLFYYLCLQVFTLCLAIASGFLGYTRSQTFFETFQNPEVLAIILTVFVAFFVYAFVSHTMSRIGYILCGGKLKRSEAFALVISILLMGSLISLDLYLNHTSIEPIVHEYSVTEAPISVDSVRQHYDSLIAIQDEKIDDMTVKYFTYNGRVSVPEEPQPWVSQSSLDQYQLLIDEKSSLMALRDTAISKAYIQNNRTDTYTQKEKNQKIDLLSFAVYIIYVFMILASLRAGMYAQQAALYLHFEPREGVQEVVVLESKEDSEGQPTFLLKPRNRDQEKYQLFLRIAKEVYEDQGRYNKAEIARRSGLARETVKQYFKEAMSSENLGNMGMKNDYSSTIH